MRLGKKVRNFVATVIVCSSLLTVRPAQAWIWPTIDLSLIGPFVSDISTAISEVTGAIAQIENYTKTISSIGDQISAVAKYAADLKNTITNIVNTVNKITANIVRAYADTETIMSKIQDELKIVNENNQQAAEETVEDVEETIDLDEGVEEAQNKLNKTREEQEKNKQNIEKMINEAADSVTKMTTDAKETVDMLLNSFSENGDLDEKTKKNLEEEAYKLKERMDNFLEQATTVFDYLKQDLNEKDSNISEAIKEYSDAIDAYYNGTMSKEELAEAGKNFKQAIKENNLSINQSAIDEMVEEAKAIVTDVDAFKESVLDSIANNKDYSDEDDENKTSLILDNNKTKRYAFHYADKRTSVLLKGVYAEDDGSFLMPMALKCKNFKIDKMEENLANFRNCVVRAKLEKEYFCPNAKDEAALNNCDPFAMEDVYEKNMETDGAYKYIVDEYGRANVVNSIKIKQYAATWQDMTNKKSTQYTLNDQFNKIDNTRNAYVHQGMIDIENPRLWSQLRRVDAMKRAQEVTTFYANEKSLYLDGRDEDFVDSEAKNLGLADISVPDGGSQKKNIISNMMLYICDLKWEDVSVAPEDKFNAEKTRKAEENIVGCMRKYVEGATKGQDDELKKQWRTRETKTITDTMFHTLALATINNYKSSKDYAEPKSGEKNIVSLQDGQNDAKTAKEDYSAGAQINYYSTKQLLTIVDADAQSLQTEIMQILPTLNYNQFPKSDN